MHGHSCSSVRLTFGNFLDQRFIVSAQCRERFVLEIQFLHDSLPYRHAIDFADTVAATLQKHSIDHRCLAFLLLMLLRELELGAHTYIRLKVADVCTARLVELPSRRRSSVDNYSSLEIIVRLNGTGDTRYPCRKHTLEIPFTAIASNKAAEGHELSLSRRISTNGSLLRSLPLLSGLGGIRSLLHCDETAEQNDVCVIRKEPFFRCLLIYSRENRTKKSISIENVVRKKVGR